jgi:hypothetical protein
MSEKRTSKKAVKKKNPRIHRVSFMFNEDEYKAIERYLKKYKIKTKSKWFRTIIMIEVWQKMSNDYPTLFNQEEMR